MFKADKLSSQMVPIQLVTKLPYGAFFPRDTLVLVAPDWTKRF